MDFTFLKFWNHPDKRESNKNADSESDSDDESKESTISYPQTRQHQPASQPTSKPVNPKVFFANERTFLHWMQFCTVLGAISIGLVNYGDRVAQIGGLAFVCVSLFLMFYALVKFHERATRLAAREKGLYDDKIGAFIAVAVIFLAIGLNFAVRLLL